MNVVGVDLGGTKVAAAAMRDGKLGPAHVVPVDTSSTEALLDQLASVVGHVREDDTVAAGFGVPSPVDFATGTARQAVNVPLKGVPMRSELEARTGLPAYVDNDATVAALAEAAEGDVENLVMLTVGTGLGGGLVIGGRIYRGATGAAAELGHILVGLDLTDGVPAPAEKFPQPGSLESVAAGTALDRDAGAAGLGRGPDAVRAAAAGDEVAMRVVRAFGRRLGIGIASMINVFDPDVVAIGGGASAAGELLLGPAREVAWQYVLPGVGTATEIRLARSGTGAGVRGAALMAAQEQRTG